MKLFTTFEKEFSIVIHLHLLQFAQSHMLFNEIGISSEFQQPSFDALAINRFTEYAQSIYVSGFITYNRAGYSEENEFNSIFTKILYIYFISYMSTISLFLQSGL